LSSTQKKKLVSFLCENSDVVAWSYENIPGISPLVIVHKLNVDPKFKPMQQRQRGYSAEKSKVAVEEVKKLCEVGFIKEVQYSTWLSNVVLVKKSNWKWRMCVDFMNLNKACLKYNFPLPHIDLLINSTFKHELLSFMDAFLSYNQISMHEFD
jgi:hypothetical protein